METKKFRAMVVTETADHHFVRVIADKLMSELPPGEVTVKVRYSSLNYKDALSASGNKGVTKRYPHTPGVDAAGVVVESTGSLVRPGDEVIVTGYDLGMNTAGGFGEYIRVPESWIVKCPDNLSLRESMVYGTAGLTAALSVFRLAQNGVTPEHGDILVTGATGGVGSIAVSLLAKDGYRVAAVTGKSTARQFLTDIGAHEVITRDEATDTTARPLLKERWAGVIDTVGGDILSTAIKSTRYGGTVTCCGNVASADLPLTVFPFILRGVSLLGIDSVYCPREIRQTIWKKLSREWKLDHLERLTTEIPLNDLDDNITRILQGGQRGRVVVNVSM